MSKRVSTRYHGFGCEHVGGDARGLVLLPFFALAPSNFLSRVKNSRTRHFGGSYSSHNIVRPRFDPRLNARTEANVSSYAGHKGFAFGYEFQVPTIVHVLPGRIRFRGEPK